MPGETTEPFDVEGFPRGPSPAPVLVPHLRLYTEAILVSSSGPLPGGDRELTLPVLCLSFDYGGTQIGANDERERFFVAQGDGLVEVERDVRREAEARAEVERFGAVELGCLDGYVEGYGSAANYLVAVDGDVHAYCAFSAQALPELRSKGFVVEVDAGYPYQVLAAQPAWYLDVGPLSERPDWFGCEIGVEIDGERVNLLAPLLELLEGLPDGESPSGRAPRGPRCWALQLDDKRYVRVGRELIDEILEVLRELYSGRRAPPRLELSRYHGGAVDTLARALGKSGVRVHRSGVQLPVPPRLDRVVTEASQHELQHGVAATLRPYQAAGVRWLLGLYTANLGGVLADDMGLGKTLQTITLFAVLHARRALDQPSLIVVPTSLIQNWQRELKRFAPQLSVLVWHGNTRREGQRGGDPFRAQLIVTSYALLVREQERWQAQPLHYLILDEAQNIKNPRSAVRAAARSLTARHRLCLSGTPVENHLGDMWSLFDFLMPDLLGSAAEFQTRYRVPIEEQRNEDKLAALRHTVGPFILRRTKEQVAKDLPPKSNLVRAVELGEAQRRLYESIRIAAHADVRRMVMTKGIAGSALTILDALMKLRQVCCDPRLVQVQAAQRVSESAKLTFLFRLVVGELGQSRRILIFSQFTSMLNLIAEGLTERGIEFGLLTGATQDRARQVDAFQRGTVDVFLISLKAGGTGLNLTSADTVIHYDPWWNPAAQAQATDRAHRIGQTRPVFVHQLIVAGSVEERMLELQHKKRELAESFIGNADAERATLSENDISSLFAPLGEAEV